MIRSSSATAVGIRRYCAGSAAASGCDEGRRQIATAGHRHLRRDAEFLESGALDDDAEPVAVVIQQQGASRIVVQLPGVEDTAEAKKILGPIGPTPSNKQQPF